MKIQNILIATAMACAVMACGKEEEKKQGPNIGSASADLYAMISPNVAPIIAKGKRIGTVTISEDKTGVKIDLDVTAKSVMPVGELGVTINEKGSCKGENFSESGGHWNPTKREHGPNNPKGFHLGDLGNAFSAIGSAQVFKYTSVLSGVGYKENLARGALMDADGFSIVIHENKDDFKTHPDGGMGKAVACAPFKI
jgi:Cu-Zn family superoxide dismutase